MIDNFSAYPEVWTLFTQVILANLFGIATGYFYARNNFYWRFKRGLIR